MTLLRAAALALAFLALPAPAAAQRPFAPAPLPPVLPWTGASEKLVAKAGDPWITPAEQAGFADTPDYAATRAWLEKLVAASPLLSLESFGTTAQGRDLYAIRARKPGGEGARKPVLLVQGGIHAGEIDGKDAGLMLLRDIALRGKQGLLDHADLVFVPIFNADGHERSSPYSRPNQRGPGSQGWRTTAQNLNLNRDYLKADTPEMQAMLALIERVDPALYLDLHVTDGTDYQYDITYAFAGWDGRYAQSPAIGRWLDTTLRPAMDAALKRAGHTPGLYIDPRDGNDPDAGINHNADAPRFSTGYGDLRRLPTVLLETHSLKPYRQRVLGTYIFFETALRLLGDHGAALGASIAADRALRPTSATLAWRDLPDPIATIDFLGVAHERTLSPASGRPEVRWLGKPIRQRMAVYGQEPSVAVNLPAAWWVPASEPQVIERLKRHGIRFETLDAPRTLTLDMVRLVDPKLGRPNEGHVPLTAGFAHEQRTESWPAGSVRVPADQPRVLLAAALLEAESPDSMLAWNYFPAILQRTEYMEGYVIAPLADRMLAEDPALKAAFQAKLAADPAFAADPDARLAWFYARTPYADQRHLLYPVARELAPTP
jgi:murein tripeptide amidase MpaA